jgi:hypothetical protein
MNKKIVLSILFALGLALTLAGSAAARPPLCTCPFCAVGNASCSLPDGSTTTCGPYFGSHCTGPNLAPRSTTVAAPLTCAVEAPNLADLLAPVAHGREWAIQALE